MYQNRDSGFTLFGRRIEANSGVLNPPNPVKSEAFSFKVTEVAVKGPRKDDSGKVGRFSTFGKSDKENQTIIVGANEEQANSQTESSGSEQEKTLKKPDKIIPCPRCNSMETKFCYFNNYNVNQPRHFCKKCQRYWTAGGMMRNVPVGAGRRKNKHLASQYRQILISSDGTPSCSIKGSDAANHQLLLGGQSENAFRPCAGNGTVLKFGRDEQSCAHMGFARNREEPSSCVSSMTSSSGSRTVSGSRNEPVMPRYPAAPWVFPCNPAQYPCEQVNGFPAPMVAVPGFYPTSIPVQFVPASYWGCMPLWPPTTGSAGCQSPPSSTSTSCSGDGSPTLGKHGRDISLIDEEKPGKCIVVPKT